MVMIVQDTEIKLGYKQTEVGIIPEDWEVSTVGAEFEIQLGKMLDAEKNTGVPKPYIGNKAVQWNRIDISDLQTMAMSRSDLERFRLRYGDLLVCEGGEVGRAAIWEAPLEECYYQKALHRLRPLRGFNPCLMLEFLRYWTDHGKLADYVSQTSIAHLTREKLIGVPIPVPKPDEQQAIATALSDVDALITSLDKLITKKRDIKQATMQQLLTGKVRLPVFGGEWEVKKLGEVVEFTNGKPYEKFVRDDGIYFLITLDSISIDGKIKKDHKKVDFFDGSLCKDDIVIVLSDIAHGDFLGLCDLIPEDNKYILNQRVGRLRTIATINPKFLSLLINYHQDHFKKRGQGTSQRHIYKRDIEALSLLIPNFEEQNAIATVLSDIDAEIVALEQKREKTRALKQAMMQELLTGKTRLI